MTDHWVFFHNILDNLLEGCQILDSGFRYQYVNDIAVSQGCFSREELLGRTMMEIFPGIEHTPVFSVLEQCMTDRIARSMKNEFTFPDGSGAWFDLRVEPVPGGVMVLSMEITGELRIKKEKQMEFEVLQLINSAQSWEGLLESILDRLKEWSGCESVGIRIKDGLDYPYFLTSGFSKEFVRLENRLCNYAKDGTVELDADGNPVLECMCGNILRKRFDPSKNFFTTDGSFLSNCTTDLLTTTTDADRQTRKRNRCNSAGYESVALIPLRVGSETFGLIQLNDRQKGRFTPEMITLFRRLADNTANFLARKKAEAWIEHLNSVLRGIRNVNQLIVREKDRDALIKKACDLLVDARGFYSAVIGLTDGSGEKVLAFAGTGQELIFMQDMLGEGKIPDCARKAMTSRKTESRKSCSDSCNGCSGRVSSLNRYDTLSFCLEQGGCLYGFMTVCLPAGPGDNLEEMDLLNEISGDIAFALDSMAIEKERDESTVALVEIREQLRQSQKLEAIGQLAGGIAHDFNNILMAQIGYCDLMAEELDAGTQLSDNLAEIRIAAERAAALIRQLLIFSRKQALQLEVLDLNTVVRGVEKMLRRLIGENIEFKLVLKDTLGRIKADPGQIEQIIVNISVNARDAMPYGGRLTIETADMVMTESDVINFSDAVAGDYVMLKITDTGCGMDKITQGRLYEPFFTTKEKGKGTGLGLATVYGIVRQAGGHIRVDSEPEKGTIFRICLPRVKTEVKEDAGKKAAMVHGQDELVLLVEDEMPLRNLFAKMIKSLGYRIEISANGEDALAMVEEKHLKPDLLITDVVMPRMSGKMLADRLLMKYPGMKTLYMSGYTDESIVHHGIVSPDIFFLQKPFDIADLSGKIHEIMP